MGNRTSLVDPVGTKSYTTAEHNLLTTVGNKSYTYDTLGNLTSKSGGYTYLYDQENRLVKALLNGTAIVSYWYDSNGNRVRSVEGGKTTYYVFDGLNVIQEDDATGSKTDYIFVASKRIAEKANGVVKYFYTDHLGSTRLVADANGNVVRTMAYDPYGAPTNGLIYPENGSFEKCSSGKLNGDPALGNGVNIKTFSYRLRASMHYSPVDEYCEVADSSTATEGGKVGRIYDNGSGTWKAFTFSPTVNLTPGKWYRISVKARVTSNPGVKYAAAFLSYNEADNSGSKYVTKWASWTKAELAGGNWVQKYVTFQVPVGYNNISITPYLYGHYGAGTVEYDDYRIEEFDSEPVGPPALNQDSEVKFDDGNRFTGKEGSAATGLVYFGARWYDPELGRFISQDPAKDGLNWYAYCNNNPLKYIDPTGKYYEASIAWGSTMWWLAAADGPVPAGDAIYAGGDALLALGETFYMCGDKLINMFQAATNNNNAMQNGADTGSRGSNSSNNNQDPKKGFDIKWKSAREIEKDYNLKKGSFHDFKKDILKDLTTKDSPYKDLMKKVGNNPDIGVDSSGNVCLKATNGSGNIISTDIPIETYIP